MQMSSAKIPSPLEFFGVMPGDDYVMLHWDMLYKYYKKLGELSGRLSVREMGLTTEKNPFLVLFVSSEKNIARLEHYRAISMKLADARGLSEEEINALCDDGKAVVMQNYSLHSNETGGAQMVPLMLYELLTADEESELYKQLEEVIFIITPCADPDGEITFTNWYNKYLGTEYEGYYSPYIRHTLTGHANNRDAIRESVVESQYINQIMVREWMPQLFMDYHHQYQYHPRMTLPPVTNPIFPAISPMVWRQTTTCAADIAQSLSRAGVKGVLFAGDYFTGYSASMYNLFSCLHNIAGMLSESADVRIASPVYMHPERFEESDRFPTPKCPEPWEGGEWHLRDVVNQMKLASLSLIEYAAKNRRTVLMDMAQKSLAQTKRGMQDMDFAYMISPNQHDKSALRQFMNILLAQNIEVHVLKEDISCGSKFFAKGTYAVLLSQPKYAPVKWIVNPAPYPITRYNTNPDSTVVIDDVASPTVSLSMGIDVDAAGEPFDTDKLERVYKFEDERDEFPLCANENISFKKVNDALCCGKEIYRDQNGNFVDKPQEGCTKLKRCRIGLMKESQTGNEGEAFARNLLLRYNYDFEIVMDKTIRENGVPENIDILIIPGGDKRSFDDAVRPMDGEGEYDDKAPVEYVSGIGQYGRKALVEFVKKGGRLISWGRAFAYINEIFDLKLTNAAEGKAQTEYRTKGSHLLAHPVKHPLTLGMPKSFNIFHDDGYIPVANDVFLRNKIETLVRIDVNKPYVNGFIRGEELLKGTPAMMYTKIGEGDLVLYTFNPCFRVQVESTFKLLLNALY